MIFKGLEIKQSYEKVGENYQHIWVGTFNIESPDGHRLMLKVTQELCQKLIALCADHIVNVAEEAASTMKATVLEQLAPLRLEASIMDKDGNGQ